ncbi:MAG: outer membrane protein assembly factor BamA [Thiothrix sp.]|nr:outer membrane protein assembly factor BamA [Thiothrix sp.]
MKKQIFSYGAVGCILMASQTVMAASFVVRDIQVRGLQRVSQDTVINYLPARVGQPFDDSQAPEAIRSVFQSGLFEDVQLARNGDVLLVSVVERPAIGDINVKGNSKVKTEQIMQALKVSGLSKGDMLDRAALTRFERELEQQYLSIGYYGAKVSTQVQPLDRGNSRVRLNISIQEGNEARIRQVRIVGNRAFSEAELLKQFESGTRNSLIPSFLSSRDQYGKQKLVGDLDALTSFYRDRGYLNFEVVSSDVSLSDDKQSVFISISINEGDQYRIGSVDVAGRHGLNQQQLNESIKLQSGAVFSQKALEETRKNLAERLGEQGFAFARIQPVPQIDNVNKRVGITLQIDPGKRAYVRRINIRGNNRTRDEVYRREMRQLESSWFSRERVERSKVRLQRLPYVESVRINAEPVAGTPDQVDLNVVIAERSSNQFRIGAGYSQSQGLLLNLSLHQDNFMGTGKQMEIDLDNSSANKNFRISYTNPYYTPNGISRGFSLYYNKYDAAQEDISEYASDKAGGNVNYTVPLSETNSLYFSAGVEQRKVILGDSPADHIQEFVNTYGEKYTQFPVTAGFVYDTRDRTIFPTEGQRHRVSLQAAVPGSDLEFQKLSYEGAFYQAITDDVTFALKGRVASGWASGEMDGLPFFEKYYAGGIRSVRGFESSSLGPLDSNGSAKGGDFLMTATAEVQFPVPFAREIKGLKMSAFVDGGNVFEDYDSFKADELRYSAGIGVVWLSPIGPLEVSYAKPLNAKDGDKEQVVQFSIGASF